ncbi:MAG TPA: FAD-dependent oxidoreductase [Acidimicrobiales bacterium]|nr:FAD-dependent oxidoreductase [Acidimicrobiales bacterium]
MDRSVALADARPLSFWLDDPAAPGPALPLVGPGRADLVVVGGGYTGLWAALLAKQDDPSCDVVLLEGDRCGWAASGRNGGFCAASLTHGLANGVERFPDEVATLERLGSENLDAIESTVTELGIECDFERTGELDVATEPHQVTGLREAEAQSREHGASPIFLEGDEVRADVHSPTFLAGLWDTSSCALVNPARLAWGLRRACEQAGVRVYEHSRVDGLAPGGPGAHAPMVVHTAHGRVAAARVVLATNAAPSPVRRLRKYVVPVYDYVLMTEPLDPVRRRAIGWTRRQGISSTGNQFVYLRQTADDRILFGGYDAVYHYGSAMGPALEQRPATFSLLATRFAEMFPQLEDVRFTHTWSGAIDTCSRFCAFFDRSFDGRVASVAGYTGLGVGASRFGARVALDLLSGADTELTRLRFVRSKPIPFPPEPVRSIGIHLTRWSLARADTHGGRRNLWLRALDSVGLGFDS